METFANGQSFGTSTMILDHLCCDGGNSFVFTIISDLIIETTIEQLLETYFYDAILFLQFFFKFVITTYELARISCGH